MSGSRGAVREDAILRATLELLAESGYDQLTIDAVAARARCSKATIYRRWPDRLERMMRSAACRSERKPPVSGTAAAGWPARRRIAVLTSAALPGHLR